MKIVLFEPQIPQNTGNIVRTCSVVGAQLYLVKPLGFQITDRHLKRAGLDYWDEVEIFLIDDFPKFLNNSSERFFFYSSHAEKSYTEVEYRKDDFLVFGAEDGGLPKWIWERYPENFCTIPQKETARCLNLSNAAAVVVYEAWRQLGFTNV